MNWSILKKKKDIHKDGQIIAFHLNIYTLFYKIVSALCNTFELVA
jgi:hypothetical protein